MTELNFRCLVPMGAIRDDKNLEEYLKDDSYIGQVKRDGFRLVGWFDHDRLRFTTRSIAIDSIRAGNPMTTERTDCVPHLRDLKFSSERYYGTVVDGEVWKPGCTSHDMTSMIGGLPETSIANQEREGKVFYQMYDILQFKGEDVTGLPYYERMKLLIRVFGHLIGMNEGTEEFLSVAQDLFGEEAKRDAFAKEVSEGREGLVLKHIEGKYYVGKVDKHGKGVPAKIKASKSKGIPHSPWVKWKKEDTYDCVIMGFNPAEVKYSGNDIQNWNYWQDELGNKYNYPGLKAAQVNINLSIIPITKFHYYGWPGSIIFGQYKDGELVQVGHTSGIKDELRLKFANNPEEYIGKVAIVEAFERITKTNALREPRFIGFHPDKNAFECTMED